MFLRLSAAAPVACALAVSASAQSPLSFPRNADFPDAIACSKGPIKNARITRPQSPTNTDYQAYFGHWCGVAQSGETFYLAIQKQDEPFTPDELAHVVHLRLSASLFDNGKPFEGFGVMVLNTRNNRWFMVVGEDLTFWIDKTGLMRGGKSVTRNGRTRFLKREQSWITLKKV